MPYYHVYILYTDKKGVRHEDLIFSCTETFVSERVANPYLKDKAFLFGGKVVHPSKIENIQIFEGKEQDPKKIILPNGKPALGQNDSYILRCFLLLQVKDVIPCTPRFLVSPPAEKKELDFLIESASFLGLDTNWSLATCALQLQEVAVTLVAEKRNIILDKTNVEKILDKKIEGELSFNDRYRAFSKQVKASFKIDMPRLATHLRRMRTEVLHQGYNPTPEETESITSFTIGLLKKLDACIEKPLPYIHLQNWRMQ